MFSFFQKKNPAPEATSVYKELFAYLKKQITVPKNAAQLVHLAKVGNNAVAKILADTLDQANAKFLESNKSPARKVGEIDNRGSHFYLALYWAQALAAQTADKRIAEKFQKIAKDLTDNEKTIDQELLAAQGKPQDVGGYYHPDDAKAAKAMRPSATLNRIIDAIA